MDSICQVLGLDFRAGIAFHYEIADVALLPLIRSSTAYVGPEFASLIKQHDEEQEL
jgi:hypothetical protein